MGPDVGLDGGNLVQALRVLVGVVDYRSLAPDFEGVPEDRLLLKGGER